MCAAKSGGVGDQEVVGGTNWKKKDIRQMQGGSVRLFSQVISLNHIFTPLVIQSLNRP
jgi:hypothetical protein